MANLTAKYRPQRFADVAGQDAVRRILSRAAAEDVVAPAYLFSGTRGVGKTTLARILAKAVNCEKAPAAEPCNVCRHCRQITNGNAPDVVEIDAATHGGVDEARRLKEDIGYAPLECRYKVFIIDEAHMLSKAAFNALLKTLEEPPGRVTFIMATTEPHKFPATIISRCQHYIFKRLPQAELEAHLAKVLTLEGIAFEPGAVSVIARRGAGSVRDCLSLLAQVLAAGGEALKLEDARTILGLAGQEVFFALTGAIAERDCLALDALLRQILDKGLDLGFFLRELTACFRNMFILSQAGEKALTLIDAAEEEAAEWLSLSTRFPLAHIHACWQLCLEGQRRVMASLEPALALELLLLNLAYLPMLVPLSGVAAAPQSEPANVPRPIAAPAAPRAPRSGPAAAAPQSPHGHGPQAPQSIEAAQDKPQPESGPKNWKGFLRHCDTYAHSGGQPLPRIKLMDAAYDPARGKLTLACLNEVHLSQYAPAEVRALLERLVREYFGPRTIVELTATSEKTRMDPAAAREDLRARDEVKQAEKALGAQVIGTRTGLLG